MGSPGAVIQGNFAGNRPRRPQPVFSGLQRKGAAHPHQRPVQSATLVQTHGADHSFPVNTNILRAAGGSPLPDLVQQKMESFFQTSFADVRIHVGHEAASIGALAFTHGSNIYFAPGLYSPHSSHGQRLLGHELTHVVQQRAGRVRNPFGAGVAVVQDPALESEADRMGARAAMTPMPRPVAR